jgi:molybdopterin-guanine dinucleotide biosynthesis protein A
VNVDAPPAVVLAGGRGLRLGGGDKPLRLLDGRPLLDHVLDRLRPQAGPVAINANGDPARFSAWALPVIADPIAGQPGPLAGVRAAMRGAREPDAQAQTVLTVPGDTPFLPLDLVARLRAAPPGRIAQAESAGRRHPVVALWPLALEQVLAAALAGGDHRVGFWSAQLGAVAVPFAADPTDPFLNVNTPDDLQTAAHRLVSR